jgi:hypothetical protein
MMTRSGFPSIALSSSFVILGASADLANIVQPPTMKKMSKAATINLFFIPHLLAESVSFFQTEQVDMIIIST